jgi:hypothetical protein
LPLPLIVLLHNLIGGCAIEIFDQNASKATSYFSAAALKLSVINA